MIRESVNFFFSYPFNKLWFITSIYLILLWIEMKISVNKFRYFFFLRTIEWFQCWPYFFFWPETKQKCLEHIYTQKKSWDFEAKNLFLSKIWICKKNIFAKIKFSQKLVFQSTKYHDDWFENRIRNFLI